MEPGTFAPKSIFQGDFVCNLCYNIYLDRTKSDEMNIVLDPDSISVSLFLIQQGPNDCSDNGGLSRGGCKAVQHHKFADYLAPIKFGPTSPLILNIFLFVAHPDSSNPRESPCYGSVQNHVVKGG